MPEASRLVTASKWPQSSDSVVLSETDTLDLSEVIEGFSCSVREIFD
jgi:hypothetical protein